jgi:F-type H+-transporting ATPase subunit delta
MSNYNVTSRYADAFTEFAEEKSVYDKVVQDVELINNTLVGSRELRNFLSSPVLKDAKKKEIIEAVFGDKINDVTVQFLNFVVDKGRIEMLQEIMQRFLEVRDEKENITDVTFKSVVELGNEQAARIKTEMESYTGKNVRFKNVVDESLIGGYTAQIKDTVLDASVKRQLERLKKTLIEE